MSKPVSMFSGYSGKENRVTNYCLLMLRMLYEENPTYLGETLSNLVQNDIRDKVGVQFTQQIKRKQSVPDGLISQQAVSIYIETKNFDWFYDSQLEKHLQALDTEESGTKVLIALGQFELDTETRFEHIRSICKAKYKDRLYFEAVSFEQFLAALQSLELPKALEDAVADLEYFFNEQNLLPTWKHQLDVVNCTGSYEQVMEHGVYLCPAIGGSYSHRRCRYFGVYKGKVVSALAQIEAVIDIDPDGEETVNWVDDGIDGVSRLQRAHNAVNELRPNSGPTRVFLLSKLYETNFIKDTSGGMQTSKQYFDVSSLNASDAKDLAERLDGKCWSDLK